MSVYSYVGIKSETLQAGVGGSGGLQVWPGDNGWGGGSLGSIRPARMASTNILLDAFVLIAPPCSLAYVLSDRWCRLKLVPTAAVQLEFAPLSERCQPQPTMPGERW
jgi:hypothetical protein